MKFTVLGVLTFAAARLGADGAAAHNVGESLVNVVFTAAVAVGQRSQGPNAPETPMPPSPRTHIAPKDPHCRQLAADAPI
ncbi:hypothetical protein [Streptomyces sp. RB17]|uniref:hypothetical protein n=1 Tax=Streptomyces sp. RB17 TaxID=2585197 RepID=UPI0018867F87|nr:hypothetical protein [Streptomyces sp. RB17]